ncbi:MAG: hypothetical protein HY236_05355 [Acidobacteria bacterium]|nr:hypothetical protein [Acidobacteriota bacterium]
MSLEDLSDRSDLIVQARCVRTWAAWDAQKQIIWTHAELELQAGLKGAPSQRIVVSEPGGMVDGIGVLVEGVPHYQAGEEVVVFLYRTPGGLLRTRGLGQGKFTVFADRTTGALAVRNNAGRLGLVSPQGAEPRGIQREELDGMGLEKFLGIVRGLVAARSEGVR